MTRNAIEGVGLSLRFPHFDDILKFDHDIPWFEIVADDFLVEGAHWKKLMRLREEKAIAMHSVGMNIGGVDLLDRSYLTGLKKVYEIFQPEWISDHLCWSAHNGQYHHDLLPIPRSEEALVHIVERINYLQDFFGRPLVLENITQYLDYKFTDYEEVDFINEVVKRADCYLLLDITNMIINHKNRKLSVESFLDKYPFERVKQFHLAGGIYDGETWIDTHSTEVGEEDRKLLERIYKMGHKIPGVIERDAELPSFEYFNKERSRIQERLDGL